MTLDFVTGPAPSMSPVCVKLKKPKQYSKISRTLATVQMSQKAYLFSEPHMQHIFKLPECKIGADRVACPVQLTNRVDVTVQYN